MPTRTAHKLWDHGGAGIEQDLMTTELNSLADGSGAITGTAITNDTPETQTMMVDLTLEVTFGTAPDENSVWDVYFVQQHGGSYEDYSVEGRPKGGHVGAFVLDNVTTLQEISLPDLVMPADTFHIYLVSDAGQTCAASGNKLKGKFHTEQAIAT
jgi:hypothetical protein